MTNIIAFIVLKAATLLSPLLGAIFLIRFPMNTLHTNIDAWIRMDAPVVRGRSFPYGDFSCTPLIPDDSEVENDPVGFILSRGGSVTWIDPQNTNGKSRLWDTLMEEMHHWQVDKAHPQDLPPECWYG